MKKLLLVLGVGLLALGVAGCCSVCPMKKAHGPGGKPAAHMPGKGDCEKCGAPHDQGKCHGDKKAGMSDKEGCAKPHDQDRDHWAAKRAEMPMVNTMVLKTMMAAGAPVTILDARSGKYDDGRRIPGAIGLGADSKDEDILNTVKSKDALIVTYCANLKCPASKALAEKLRTLGYKHVLEYPFGIEGWVEGGNAVSTVAK